MPIQVMLQDIGPSCCQHVPGRFEPSWHLFSILLIVTVIHDHIKRRRLHLENVRVWHFNFLRAHKGQI